MTFKIHNLEPTTRMDCLLEDKAYKELDLKRGESTSVFLLTKELGEDFITNTNVIGIKWPTPINYQAADAVDRTLPASDLLETEPAASTMTVSAMNLNTDQSQQLTFESSTTSIKVYVLDKDGDGDEDFYIEDKVSGAKYFVENLDVDSGTDVSEAHCETKSSYSYERIPTYLYEGVNVK